MLEVKNLRKTFGDNVAVDGLDFTIRPGEIMGLIGPNGAGKTTTFRMILNLMAVDSGTSSWKGQVISGKILNEIGYLPEERGMYPRVTIENQIVYFAELRGMKASVIKERIDDWMERFEVVGNKKDEVRTLSKGNQQKVQLITTLIHEPDLIILDEPFSGLDPVNADLLLDGILEARERGASIIFSSHNMRNVEDICDHLIMLRKGKQVLQGGVQEIRDSFGRTRLFLETEISAEELKTYPGVLEVSQDKEGVYKLILESSEYGKLIFDQVTQGEYIQTFSHQPPSLDEIFKMKAGESNE
jgi:ABC-2 type transport system ATP-binding protein